MLRRLSFGSFVLVLFALYACKSEDAKPPEAGEPTNSQPFNPQGGSSGSANEADSGATVLLDEAGVPIDAGSCTDVPLTGVIVDEDTVAVPAPGGTGGTITDGTYDLTQIQKYIGATGTVAGPTGVTYQSTIRLTNGTAFERDVVIATNTTTGQENRSAGIIVSISPNTTITFNCPTATQEQYAYTATSTSLVLTNITTGESYTYTRKL